MHPRWLDRIARVPIRRYLIWVDRFALYVGSIAIACVFVASVHTSTASEGGVLQFESWQFVLREQPLVLSVDLLECLVYSFGRWSAKIELSYVNGLFPAGKIPTAWRGLKHRLSIFFSSVAFVSSYCALIWFSGNVLLLSFIMTVVACIDWRARVLIKDELIRYLSDDYFSPHPGDQEYEIIRERRHVVERYLDRPHSLKEGLRTAGYGVAFVVSIWASLYGGRTTELTSYAILVIALLVNEGVTLAWRRRMVRDMKVTVNRMRGGNPHDGRAGRDTLGIF